MQHLLLLTDLNDWLKEGLIQQDDFEKKRSELVAACEFGPLSAHDAHTALKRLKQLRDTGLLTPEEATRLQQQALSRLTPAGGGSGGTPSQTRATRAAQGQAAHHAPGATAAADGRQSETTDSKYFGYYADFAHQELMLNDAVRTGTYCNAILQNHVDFHQKVVVDVGTGTGILAMFAAKAGARKVYAVEASNMAETAERLVAHNNLSHIVTVVRGKVEDLQLPEQADILVSEPLGFFLVNEQMIQSYVVARDKWLKPGGLMFPCYSKFYVAPAYLPEVRRATQAKSQGWVTKQNFYGLDYTVVEQAHIGQNMRAIIVDQVLPSQIVGPPTESMVDFRTITVHELDNLSFNFEWAMPGKVMWDSVVMWYDTYFEPSASNTLSGRVVCLPTAPDQRLTCWYQSLMLMPEARLEERFCGRVTMTANRERTYEVTVYGGGDEAARETVVHQFSFVNPVYRYYDHYQDMIWDAAQLPGYAYLAQTRRSGRGQQQQQQQQGQQHHRGGGHLQPTSLLASSLAAQFAAMPQPASNAFFQPPPVTGVPVQHQQQQLQAQPGGEEEPSNGTAATEGEAEAAGEPMQQ